MAACCGSWQGTRPWKRFTLQRLMGNPHLTRDAPTLSQCLTKCCIRMVIDVAKKFFPQVRCPADRTEPALLASTEWPPWAQSGCNTRPNAALLSRTVDQTSRLSGCRPCITFTLSLPLRCIRTPSQTDRPNIQPQTELAAIPGDEHSTAPAKLPPKARCCGAACPTTAPHHALPPAAAEPTERCWAQMSVGFKDPRVTARVCDGIEFVKSCAPDTYDCIVVDSSDPVGPAEVLFEKVSGSGHRPASLTACP
jgi:hypothetical protein